MGEETTMPHTPVRVLFLCTGNSCRSQMAEGWAAHLDDARIETASAGIERHGMNPLTVRVMKEAGVDISNQWSKTLDDLDSLEFDYVITLCGHAHETCPRFPGHATVLHHGFDDPATLGKGLEEEAALDIYRRVRDQIRDYVQNLPGELSAAPTSAELGFSV